jgi:hypothetical protein
MLICYTLRKRVTSVYPSWAVIQEHARNLS